MTSYCTSKSTKSGLETGGAVEDESNSQLISNPHNSLTNPHNSLNSIDDPISLRYFRIVFSLVSRYAKFAIPEQHKIKILVFMYII